MLNERFLRIRERNSLSCNAAATLMGVSRHHLHLIEKGEVSPRVEFVEKFAAVFSVNVNWMLTGVDLTQDDKLSRILEIINNA